jgi:catechol 2,3-dioxygenase-like lactoylglutathione lyase family enzyme
VLTSRPIIAFVATTKPARARRFYAATLGLPLVSQDPFALVFDAGGTMLRVAVVRELTPAPYAVLGWIVGDIETAVARLRRRGVRFRRFRGMGQNRKGIWTSPSGARVAWFADPDGNMLSLTQFEPNGRRPRRVARLSLVAA